MTESLVLEDVGVQGATGWLARNLTFGLLPGQVLAVVSPQSADSLRGLLAIVGSLSLPVRPRFECARRKPHR